MPQSPGEPNPTEARVEPTNSEEFDQANSRHDLYEAASEESSTVAEGAAESEDWWTTPEPGAIDWAEPASSASATQIDPPKKSDTADVYFCPTRIDCPPACDGADAALWAKTLLPTLDGAARVDHV